MLSEQAKEARREYKRKWAKANPDKIQAQQERYWERRAAAADASECKEEPAQPGTITE